MPPDHYRLPSRRSPISRVFYVIIGIIAAAVIFVVVIAQNHVTIVVQPKTETIAADFNAEISAHATGDQINGQVLNTVVRGTEKITDVERRVTDLPASGKVTIHNELDQDQALVAKTRLLSDQGVLFRLKNRVDARAHSTVETEVYADQPGHGGEIGPARFTIPGLWTEWQNKIYATSDAPMTGGEGEADFISQAVIDQGTKQTIDKLTGEAKDRLRRDLKSGEKILDDATRVEMLSSSVSVKPDTLASDFTVSAEIRFTAVVFDEAALRQLAERKLREKLEPGQEIKAVEDASPSYILIIYDLSQKTATLAVHLEAASNFQIDLEKINLEKLIGRNREEVIDYLQRTQPISEVEVKFSPSWISTVPADTNKISLTAKE